MATEKDIALAVYLIRMTNEGRIDWEPTATNNEFTASLQGKYNVVLRKSSRSGYRYEDEPFVYTLTLRDQSEQDLVSLTDTEFADLIGL